MAEKKRWKKVEVKKLVSSMDEPEVLYRLPSGFAGREIEVFEDAFEALTVRHVAKKETKMRISKRTVVKYSMKAEEISKIVLASMGLQEDLVESIVFIADGAGGNSTKLEMEITMSFKDDPAGEEE